MRRSETRPSERGHGKKNAGAAPLAKVTRRSQAERREKTRTQILEASSVLIRKRGVGGLRTQEVAEFAGVSQGAQFHHFPTKDDLVVATFDYINDRFAERSQWEASEKSSVADVLAHIIEDAFDFYFSDAFYLDLAFGVDGESPLLDQISNRTRKSRRRAETVWCKALEAKGLADATALDVLAMTVSLVRGFGVRFLIEKDRAEFVRLSKVWQGIILAHIAASAPPRQIARSKTAAK